MSIRQTEATNRFTRLFTPTALAILTAAVIGANVGLASALNARRAELSRQYRLDSQAWYAFQAEVWQLQAGISLAVGMFTAVGIVAAPELRRNDRQLLRQIARKKLTADVLSDREIQLWSALLEEVESRET